MRDSYICDYFMKTIFITARVPIIARYILRSGLLELLKKEPNFQVVLLVSQQFRDAYEKEFGAVAIIVGLPPMPHSFFSRVLLFFSHIGLNIGTNTMIRMREYERGESSFFLTKIKGAITRAAHNSNILKKIVRRLELFISPPLELARAFDMYRPSLICATALLDDVFDIPVLREAKRRRIQTVALARNWDNFVTYGFSLLLPDWFLAQNEFLRETAVKFQAMPEERIRVIGFPLFDRYLKKEFLQTRESFCKELGIDPSKKIILYGAMGDFMFPYEGEIAEVFEELMEKGKISHPSVMIFRAHPAFVSPLEKMKTMKHVVPDKAHANRWSVGDPNTDFTDLKHFINSLYHSDIVVTTASTVGMEATAFDRPVISVAFEKTKISYWLSAKRFRDDFYHWVELMKCGGIRKADSPKEFADVINAYLANLRLDADGRECVRKRFVHPYDGKATERLAQLLVALARGESL
jgi:hypothetical protein